MRLYSNISYNIIMESKEQLLSKLYYDPSGFQSQQKLYEQARKLDRSITMKEVRDWHQRNIERTRYYGGTNSFVAPHAHYEYQIDMFFISDLENQKFKIGMACIDIFTKFAVVVPIASKQIPDFMAGLLECLAKMAKKPKFIMSDEEGAMNSNDVKAYLKKQSIEVIQTRSHAHFVERFIRTFKFMLRKRIDYDVQQGKENIQWIDYVFPILLTYNHKNEHSATNMTPAEAGKDDKELHVKFNLELKAKRDRKYPPIGVGSKVKILLKYNKFKKEHQPMYSDLKYDVEKIEERHGLKFYFVNGKQRLRSELLLVKN